MFPNLSELLPANTPAELTIFDNEKDMYGEDITIYSGNVNCNVSTKAHKSLGSNNTLIQTLTTTVFIFDNLNLQKDIITSGFMMINGTKYTIDKGFIQRDPFDNNYLFVKLELI